MCVPTLKLLYNNNDEVGTWRSNQIARVVFDCTYMKRMKHCMLLLSMAIFDSFISSVNLLAPMKTILHKYGLREDIILTSSAPSAD